MCSIFGYIARASKKPCTTALQDIIAANISRGPHAYGLAWIDEFNRLHCFKSAGNMIKAQNVLRMVRNARMLIGHLRWATHGDPADNSNNHPHPADGGWLVHNGVVTNHQSLINRHRLPMSSECDSEVLCRLFEFEDGTRLARTAASVDMTTGFCATLGLWSRPNTMIIARRGNPLHYSITDEGLYIGSVDRGLPAKTHAFPDNFAHSINYRSGKFNTKRIALSTSAGSRLYDASTYAGG